MLPQIDISNFSSQIFWLIIFFGFLYFFVEHVVVRNIEKIYTNRDKMISHLLKKTQDNNLEAEKLLQQAQIIETDAKLHAQKIREKIINKSKQENKHILQKTIQKIKKNQEEFDSNLTKEVAEFSNSLPHFTQKFADMVLNKISKETDTAQLK